MQLIFIRHGSTPSNEAHRYIGITDEGISALGNTEIESLGQNNDVSYVYTSSLIRTRQTAKLCFPNAKIIALDAFNELNFGDFEYRTFAGDLEHDLAYRTWLESNCQNACPSGEDRRDINKRVAQAFTAIVNNESKRDTDRIFIVGHGGTIMSLMDVFARKTNDSSYFDWNIPHATGLAALVTITEQGIQLSKTTPFNTLAEIGL